MQYIKTFDKTLDNLLVSSIQKTDVIRGLVHLLLALYVARLAPSLPKQVLILFENQYFKLFVFSLILWTAQFSPSTAIMISLAFIITINYANQKPLWEFLENVEVIQPPVVPSQQEVANAIQTLGEGAVSTQAVPPEQIIPAANIAAAAVQTQDGLNAVKALAEQAMAPEAAKTEVVLEAAKVAAESTVPIPVELQQVAKAIQTLGEGAASTQAVPAEQIIPAANIAAAAVQTQDGLNAVKALAEQAMAPEAAKTEVVLEAAKVAAESTLPMPVELQAAPAPAPAPAQPKEPLPEPAPVPQEQGCYPVRKYDMSKVNPLSYDNYSMI